MVRFSGFDDLLAKQAEICGDRCAILFEQGGKKEMTYREFDAAVRRRAAGLAEGGGTCIGILCDGSCECVLTIFGAVLAGFQTVLLDGMSDPEQLQTQLEMTDVDRLWGDGDLVEELSPCSGCGVTDGRGKILFFTSGTTSFAKAVVLTDRSLMSSAWNGGMKLPLSPDDRLLCMLPLNHVFGMVCGLLWALSCGASAALGRGARHYHEDCMYFRPTAVSLVPLLLGFLLQRRLFNPELKLVLVGAGDCPQALLAAAGSLGIRISFGYGLTETSSGVAISVEGDPFAMEICPDDRIMIADDGEILIEAPTCIMQGYYKNEADTAEVLRDGIFYSGDLGYFDKEGKLHINGRKKEIIVLPDGTKVYLPEYEAALSAVLKSTELAVIPVGDMPALVIRSDGRSAEEIGNAISDIMAARPRGQQIRKIILTDEALPRTATGKIKRWEIQKKVVKT